MIDGVSMYVSERACMLDRVSMYVSERVSVYVR